MPSIRPFCRLMPEESDARFHNIMETALPKGPRRSKLSFVVSPESTERISVDRLKRVREPVSRSKAGVQGKIADVMNGRSRHAESRNEFKAFRILLATGRSAKWQEQPFVLEYHHEGKIHRYTPDVLVVRGPHVEVVEIKEDAEAELAENQSRFAFIRELLDDHGYQFRIWKSSEIYAEPRLTNVDMVLRYRCVDVLPIEYERIRRAFALTAELPLRNFHDGSGMTVPSVLHLVLDGVLHIDWWKPLSLNSAVSITPIGPQVWPFTSLDRRPEPSLTERVSCGPMQTDFD